MSSCLESKVSHLYTPAMEQRTVTVRVPATTANLGPGFDCLGMALDWWNDVRMGVSSSPQVHIRGEGAHTLSTGESNLVFRAAKALFREAGEAPPSLSIGCENRIPLARGLGSSAAAIVGGLMAANALVERPISQKCLLSLAVGMEGHADNVTPALLGGCQVVVMDGDRVVTASVPLPSDLIAVVFVPDVAMATQKARAILPAMVSREDAVYNLGRVSLLVNALATGRLEELRVATQDRLHQPEREKLFPAMRPIFQAARDAGALGVFLSGSGSSILALAESDAEAIGREMARAAEQAGVQGSVKVSKPSPLGAHLVSAE
ncbi:MAG: Homoserine kinase [Dehalococcoidia bacterium]|nr:Homoserine kinase [Dehalococcoidia bacterium]